MLAGQAAGQTGQIDGRVVNEASGKGVKRGLKLRKVDFVDSGLRQIQKAVDEIPEHHDEPHRRQPRNDLRQPPEFAHLEGAVFTYSHFEGALFTANES